MKETLFGIQGPDFVMMLSDSSHIQSIIVMKNDTNKIHKVADNLIVGTIGRSGDTDQFTEFVAKNIALYKMRNGYDMTPNAAAHFIRKNLADYLRSQTPYEVYMVVAGYDEKDGPTLVFIDNWACSVSLKHGGHGYGSLFSTTILDRYYNEKLTQQEAYDILKKCVFEIQKRVAVNLPNFDVVVVDKEGVKNLPQITPATLVGYKP